MSEMPNQNFDRAHTASKYCISQNWHLLCQQQKKTCRKYSVNTLVPCPVLGYIVMEANISKLENDAVEHDLPGGGNATTHAVGIYQHIQDLIHTAKC